MKAFDFEMPILDLMPSYTVSFRMKVLWILIDIYAFSSSTGPIVGGQRQRGGRA